MVKRKMSDYGAISPKSNREGETPYRSLTVRSAYLGQARANIQVAVKELARKTKSPTEQDNRPQEARSLPQAAAAVRAVLRGAGVHVHWPARGLRGLRPCRLPEDPQVHHGSGSAVRRPRVALTEPVAEQHRPEQWGIRLRSAGHRSAACIGIQLIGFGG